MEPESMYFLCLPSLTNITFLRFAYFICISSFIPLVVKQYPLYEDVTILFVLPHVSGHLNYFQFLQRWVKLLWTFLYMSFNEHMFSFSLGKYLGWDCWLYSKCVFNFVRLPRLFPKGLFHLTFPLATYEVECRFCPWKHLPLGTSVNIV